VPLRLETDPRRGGDVIRYHTWPTLQQQTTGQHSWNVVRILVTLWPEAPKEAILNAQFHDSGEVGTGDAPYPVKANNPDIKRGMDRIEGEIRAEMGVGRHMNCDQFWRDRIKLCDCIEMWEFGLDEVHFGNRFAELVVSRMAEQIDRCSSGILTSEEHARLVQYREERVRRYL
jgi:chloramphenicol 3-O-phosphotransferase